MKPYSDACDENRKPILAVIRQEFSACRTVLEIGSGTGQHAVYFARQLPHLTWQLSANTCHIMSWSEVEAMFRGIGKVLLPGGVLCLYGPFNYHNAYTSDSNARFDAFLKSRDPASGIRNLEDLDSLAAENGMRFHQDHDMPVNNRLLVWSRQ